MITKGNFNIELSSDYGYRRGTIIKIDGCRYEFVQEIIDTITPILDKEKDLIKKELEEEEKE